MGFDPDRFIEKQERKLNNITKERKMAWSRRQVGSVVKQKDEKLKYKDDLGIPIKEFSIKFSEDISFKKGEYVNLENKALKLASLKSAKDKMSPEAFEKTMERIEKMPEFVMFELIKVENK